MPLFEKLYLIRELLFLLLQYLIISVIEKLIKCFLGSVFKTTPVNDPFLL